MSESLALLRPEARPRNRALLHESLPRRAGRHRRRQGRGARGADPSSGSRFDPVGGPSRWAPPNSGFATKTWPSRANACAPRPRFTTTADRGRQGAEPPNRGRHRPLARAALCAGGRDGPQPLFVFFHGGGFVLGDVDTHDAPCRLLCRESRVHVLSVDYRLAPEHPFPAAVDDAIAAFRWAQEHAAELGADPDALLVGGDDAGRKSRQSLRSTSRATVHRSRSCCSTPQPITT